MLAIGGRWLALLGVVARCWQCWGLLGVVARCLAVLSYVRSIVHSRKVHSGIGASDLHKCLAQVTTDV